MTQEKDFEIFLATTPGLEAALSTEVSGKGFKKPKVVPGGVIIKGGWPEVWRANLWIRGASRILARLDIFRAQYLDQLEIRAQKVPWGPVLHPSVPFRVEATCSKSKIYHSDAAAERIAKAIHDTLGAPHSEDADVLVMARFDHDVCTISVDTSGQLLHKRGYKDSVGQAPMRETMASLFLQQCGYDGKEPVFDPMCGSGTFIIEAAEVAARLNPGRSRDVKSARKPSARYYGSDRDAAAVKNARANAERAGVADFTEFQKCMIADISPPEGPPGLVIVNPPYGARLGDKKKLLPLYQALGQALKARFKGWRVGIITTEKRLAHATGLTFLPAGEPVQHGGLRVTLFQTDKL
jgi:putative N6-adenine-specific DNA methylase